MTPACRPAPLAAVRRRSLRRGVLALAALAAAPAVQAQYSPGPQFLPAPRGYLSRVGNAVRAAAGIFVTPFAAFELAAADFGDSRIGTPYGDAEFNVRMAGFGLALTLDYGARFNGLLRFGVAQVQATWQAPWAWPAESRSTSAEGYYGVTLGYMLAPNLAAELSFDGTRYETGDRVERVDALTLGLSLRF